MTTHREPRRAAFRVAALGLFAVAFAACSGATSTGSTAPGSSPATAAGGSGSAASAAAASSGDPTKDKLAQVQDRGTLVVFVDPDYAPQSMAVKGATRAASTKCAPNQMTGPEVDGYDVVTAKLVAGELGVEPCFVAIPFDEVIAGGWGDRIDVAWGSGALTESRMKALYMTQPYYTTPANFFVKKASSYQKPSDLSGKQIGACSGCTHEQYLKHTLALPGEQIDFAVTNPKIVTYAHEPPGLHDVATGKIDAFLCSQPVGVGAIKDGEDLRMLDTQAFTTFKTGYVDKSLTLAAGPFVDAIDKAVKDLIANGKLKAASEKFFGTDYATAAGAFDLTSINQTVQ
jgi:polar amino acid transport system substrate-binding protein